MICPNCGAPLPDTARFCYSCGTPMPGAPPVPGAAPPPPPPPPPAGANRPTVADAGVKAFKCPSCGAPLDPSFGDMVVSCEYCGSSVSLGSQGWKAISKHSMLIAKVTNQPQLLEVVRKFVDTGFFHRKTFEESTVAEAKLSYVPFWLVPASATTNYTYQDVAVGVGSTVATIAASEVLGSAFGGRRGGFIPIVTGPTVNPTRQDTLSGSYEFPVIAVKSMTAYQPKDYQFRLTERTIFDKKQLPSDVPLLNGDVGEDVAQSAARAYVTQLQTEAAHKKHMMVSQLNCQVQVGEAELLHAPIYTYTLDRKGARSTILVDAHAAQVIRTLGP
ncbi:MAG TPA: zinc ribbon domain-containing protein [Thermoplasmata archaeon]|nr:zinc ribbon domain-containing protein [Thermoplasmata archaeon]